MLFVTPLTLGRALALRFDPGTTFHQGTVEVAFNKCEMSLKLDVGVALRYGVPSLLSVWGGRAELISSEGQAECLSVFSFSVAFC